MASPIPVYPGAIFGRLLVLADAGKDRWYNRRVRCSCLCGRSRDVLVASLRAGRTRSCGCLSSEFAPERGRLHERHGHAREGAASPEYEIWTAMKARCLNPKRSGYEHYGGRGIEVCDRWANSFQAFLADMGERPGPEFSIDRIDNDGPYSPENCAWRTRQEQCRNRRNNRFLTIDGKTRLLIEWAELADISGNTIRTRLKIGWSPADAVFTPAGQKPGTPTPQPHDSNGMSRTH